MESGFSENKEWRGAFQRTKSAEGLFREQRRQRGFSENKEGSTEDKLQQRVAAQRVIS